MGRSSRATWAFALAFAAAGCGGRTVGETTETDDAGPADASTGPEADAAPDATDAPICVHIDPSSYDHTCTSASDCLFVTVGTLCSGDCNCPGAAINVGEAARYAQAILPIRPSDCPCTALADPSCVNGMCVVESTTVESGLACVDVAPTNFDHACASVSDCVTILEAQCDGGCNCGADDAVSASSVPLWKAVTSSIVSSGTCDCVASKATCSQGTCGLCSQMAGPGCGM